MIKAKKELDEEVDETRQRGLKGNIILSSPHSETYPTLLVPENTASGGRETDLEMCLRLIQWKTTVSLQKEDVVACHRLGDTDRAKYSYVIRVNNHVNDRAWDKLATGMQTGKIGKGLSEVNFQKMNVYLNFQLTKKRMAITHQCRMLQTRGRAGARDRESPEAAEPQRGQSSDNGVTTLQCCQHCLGKIM